MTGSPNVGCSICKKSVPYMETSYVYGVQMCKKCTEYHNSIKKKHKFGYCPSCGWMVVCSNCGYNSCGGATGTLKDGSECPDCDDAYHLQENPTQENLYEIIYMLENKIRVKDGLNPYPHYRKKT